MPLIITIAVAVLLVVAMICGTVIWIMQRTMTLNEKYIDARLAEVRSETAQPPALPPTPASMPVVTPGTAATEQPSAPAVTETPKPAARPKAKPTPKVVPQVSEKQKKPVNPPAAAKPVATTPAKPAKPAPTTKTPPAPQKRRPPVELPASKERLGPDGLPMDRIILPVGSDEVDWQL